MYTRLLSCLLLCLSLLTRGQAQRMPFDTTTRPPANRVNLSVDPLGRLWNIYNTGNKLAHPTYLEVQAATAIALGGLQTVTALSGLTSSTLGQIQYQNSVWTRRSGTPNADGGTIIIDNQAGFYHQREVRDRRITPKDFNGVPNDGGDDDAALQAWVNATGNWEHYLPSGDDYQSATTITRTDKGAFTLSGKGRILFTGDSDGLRIANTTNLGAIVIRGPQLVSTSAKTSRTALYVSTLTFRPGPIIDDVTITCGGSAPTEWLTGVQVHNSIGSSLSRINVQAYNNGYYGITTAILYTQSANVQSFEHKLHHIDIQNVSCGIDIQSATTGQFGIEGIQFSDVNVTGCFRGIRAICQGGSPFLGFRGVHVNAFGAEALYIKGYQQIYIDESNDFYVNRRGVDDATGTTPVSAVKFENTLAVKGALNIVTYHNTQNCVEFAGTGGLNKLRIAGQVSSAQTNLLNNTGSSSGTVDPERQWTQSTTYGSVQGSDVLDPGKTWQKVVYIVATPNMPANGSLVRFRTTGLYQFEAVSPVLATALQDGLYVTASQTIDPSIGNLFRIDNGATAITLTIDVTKYVTGSVLTFVRVNETSTGTITITPSSASNKIGSPSGLESATFSLPATPGQRVAVFYCDGVSLKLLSTYGNQAPAPTVVSISGWTTTTYNQLYAPKTLTDGGSYTLKIRIDAPGTDTFMAVYNLVICGTGSGGGGTQPADLAPGNIVSYSGSRSGFKVRLKVPTGGGGTYGIEATTNDAALSGASSTLTYSLIPLF